MEAPKDRGFDIETTGDLNVVRLTPTERPRRVRDLPPAPPDDAPHSELWGRLQEIDAARIPLGQLRNVDPTYQREKVKALVRRIREAFDYRAIGAPLVNLRADGSYWVIDGQNRVGALREVLPPGEREQCPLLCIVLCGLEGEDEAGVFVKNNSRDWTKNTTPYQEWRAALKQRDRETLAIERILADLGLAVGQTEGPQTVRPIGSVRRVYREAGEAGLRTIFGILLGAWRGQEDVFAAMVLNGTYAFWRRYRREKRYSEELLIRRLAGVRPRDVMLKGKDIYRDTLGANVAMCFARAILEHYNRRTSNRLPPWFEGRDDD